MDPAYGRVPSRELLPGIVALLELVGVEVDPMEQEADAPWPLPASGPPT
jgi:hypothetical protein